MIGRFIVCGAPPAGTREAHALLRRGLAKLKKMNVSVKFIITPGGFFKITTKNDWHGCGGWKSGADDIIPFVEAAQQHVRKVVDSQIVTATRGCADILTLGVDVSAPNGFYAELVAIIDLRPRKHLAINWTGKSYPTSGQERKLIQVTDLSSHCVRLDRERILILGCHDLSMWSPRGAASRKRGTNRWQRCNDMDRLVHRFQPTVILHHPHATDSTKIWLDSWTVLRNRLQHHSKAWSSAICYTNSPYPCREPLGKVLTATKSEDLTCIDIKVKT